MKPLRVTIRLKTPVVVGAYPITLDGLLSAVAALEESGGDRRSPLDAAYARRPDLPLAMALGPDGRWVWRASAGFFWPVAYPIRMEYVRTQPFDTTPFYRGPRFPEGSGIYRKYKISHLAVAAPEMRFWAVGDPDGVARLLSRVPGIGKKRAAGWGAVSGFTVEEVCRTDVGGETAGYTPEDYGLWLRPEDAVPGGGIGEGWSHEMLSARPIPLPMVPPERQGWGITAWCAARPPYWDRAAMELCLIPPWGAHFWSSGPDAFPLLAERHAPRMGVGEYEEEEWEWASYDFDRENFFGFERSGA